MPIIYVIDRVQQQMITHVEGLVTFDDISQHLDARNVTAVWACRSSSMRLVQRQT
jgi:hypothetical protein